MTRAAYVFAVVFCLCAWSLTALLLNPKSPAAAIFASLAGGLMLTYAVVVVVKPYADQRDAIVRDRRVIR